MIFNLFQSNCHYLFDFTSMGECNEEQYNWLKGDKRQCHDHNLVFIFITFSQFFEIFVRHYMVIYYGYPTSNKMKNKHYNKLDLGIGR